MSATFFGHPRGLATLFFTEMWERFTYYGMRAVLVLFLVSAVSTGGFGIDDKTAAAIYGLYTAGAYLVALPGRLDRRPADRRAASRVVRRHRRSRWATLCWQCPPVRAASIWGWS